MQVEKGDNVEGCGRKEAGNEAVLCVWVQQLRNAKQLDQGLDFLKVFRYSREKWLANLKGKMVGKWSSIMWKCSSKQTLWIDQGLILATITVKLEQSFNNFVGACKSSFVVNAEY